MSTSLRLRPAPPGPSCSSPHSRCPWHTLLLEDDTTTCAATGSSWRPLVRGAGRCKGTTKLHPLGRHFRSCGFASSSPCSPLCPATSDCMALLVKAFWGPSAYPAPPAYSWSNHPLGPIPPFTDGGSAGRRDRRVGRSRQEKMHRGHWARRDWRRECLTWAQPCQEPCASCASRAGDCDGVGPRVIGLEGRVLVSPEEAEIPVVFGKGFRGHWAP